MTESKDKRPGPLGRAARFLRGHKILALLAALFFALTAARLPGLMAPKGGPLGPGGSKEPVYVELAEARHGTMRNISRYYGTLSAPNRFSLSAKVGGEILEIRKDIGDRLESGDLVAVLDDEEYALARDRAQLSVKLAEAQLAEARANLELAKSDMARQASLTQKSIVTQSEYEAAENRLLQAEARLDVAASQLESARNQLADAELRLSYTMVRASWPGGPAGGFRYVGQRLADAGTLVVANTPILELVSLDPLLVVVDVMEKDYPRIAPGMEAAIATEAYPGEAFVGRVARVAPVLSADSRQARVELEVANPGLRLKPGMFAEVLFVFEERPGAWSVAQDVPFRRHDGYVIFVADPLSRTVKERPVTLGIVEGDRVELVGSEPIGGPVVVLGQHLLTDGQPYLLPGEGAAAEPVPAGGTKLPGQAPKQGVSS
jgi:RND family efflux transporter MFP subunit